MQQNNSESGSGEPGLECRVMVKIGAGIYQWELVGRPGRFARNDGEALPLELMQIAMIGDELWWHVKTDSKANPPSQCAGWSLARQGHVIRSLDTFRKCL